MELRQLRSFRALARTLNFSRAAEAVHVSQSTLSHQIQQLEAETGRLLFARSSRKVTLTEAGQVLLVHALRALAEVDDALVDLRKSSEALPERLCIGATPTFGVAFVPDCALEFHRLHPSVKLVIEESGATRIAECVAEGRQALGICYEPEELGTLHFEPLFNEELMLIVGPTHPFGKRKRVRMIELHGIEMALPPEDFSTRRLLDRLLKDIGAVPAVVAEFNSIASVLGFVERSQIATVLSEHAIRPRSGLSVIPIESPNPLRTPGLLWRRERPRNTAAESFAMLLRDIHVRSRWMGRRQRKEQTTE